MDGDINDSQLKKKELDYKIPRKELKEFLEKLINSCSDNIGGYLEDFKKMKYANDFKEAIDEIEQKFTKDYGDIIAIDYDSDDFNRYCFEYDEDASSYNTEEFIEGLFEELAEYGL